ncbi:MAG TPA: response regulator [Polyangia bacterium]|nr:response regulator [Polyangia bacterium]
MSHAGESVWQEFLAETQETASALAAASRLAALATVELHRLVGALFTLRASAAMLGVDAIGRAATALETALSERGADDWAGLRDPLREGADALTAAAETLSRPDASGARLEDTSALDALPARLGLSPLTPVVATIAPSATPPLVSDAAASEPSSSSAADDTLWVPQVDADMVEPFLEEAAERIEALAQKLLRLETAPNDVELVREIFRDLHTIKGSSAFVGLQRMNRLAHAAEDLVGQLRDGARMADRPLVDALLGALDGLRAILRAASAVDATAGARIDVPIAAEVARLRAVATGAPLPSPPSSSPSSSGSSPKPGALDTNALAAASASGGESKQTLRVDFDKLDTLLNLVGELVLAKARLHGSVTSVGVLGRELDGIVRRARHGSGKLDLDDIDRFSRILAELGNDMGGGAGALDHVTAELRQQVMKLRMLPIARVFTKYHRTVRELAHALDKKARLELEGADTELDKVLLEQLDDPLLHLVRNAVDHGLETPDLRRAAGKPEEGVVTLAARHRGNQIIVEVRDDGAGLEPTRLRDKARAKSLATEEELASMDDTAVLDLIFRPGFSTAARVTDVSGRGVGMDVVRETVTRLSGTIELSSTPGQGATFTLKLPLTLAIVQVLLVRIAGEDYALPVDIVVRTLAVAPEQIHRVYDRDVIFLGDAQIPLIWAADALELELGARLPVELGGGGDLPVVLVDAGGQTYGLAVERLLGKREIVLKSLGALLQQVPCAAGATLIGERVAVILDVAQVIQRGLQRTPSHAQFPTEIALAASDAQSRPRILVAEDSDVIRESLKRVLEAHGYEVVAARDGKEALDLAARDPRGFDLVSTDVVMPNLDGYELARALRQQPRHKDVPMIMVTSKSEPLDRVRGFDAGVDDYLTKPLDGGELLRAVERHLATHRRTT